MNRKDILELRGRLKKDSCTFTKVTGAYVNNEKSILFDFKESFLNLDESEYFKYLEIAKKVFSGTIGNNLLELNFKPDKELGSTKQNFLIEFKKSRLDDDIILQDFYKSIIENYDYEGNYLILAFHDVYDVITKTSDNLKLDESEDVYEYIICAICPVSLSEPGLIYFEEEQKIKARIRDWVVDNPTVGFVYPAFIDRGPDVNSIMYYTKNPKDTHPEIMEETLGCSSRQTKAIQKQNFKVLIDSSINTKEEDGQKVLMQVQENLHSMVEEHHEVHGNTDLDPIALTIEDMENALIESGAPEEVTNGIKTTFELIFEEELPLVENLIDKKLVEANAQRKKEEHLRSQVHTLQTKLREANNLNAEYDIIVRVTPNKIPTIKTEVIDGQKCIIIPVDDNEKTKINELDDLV